jgi:hypothetical protein
MIYTNSCGLFEKKLNFFGNLITVVRVLHTLDRQKDAVHFMFLF